MNPSTVGMLAVISATSAVALEVPEHIKKMFTESVAAVQQVSTAGDLKSISTMLDVTLLMDRHLVGEKEFAGWLEETFKNNNVKGLTEDHWGFRYIYTVTGRRYELRSVGPDGVANTEDDLWVSGP